MTDKNKSDARRLALKVLQAVIVQGESLSTCLPVILKHSQTPKDKAFAQMLVYGVLRWYWRLTTVLPLLIKKPLKEKDSDIQIILLMALYQLMDTRVPDYASVDAAVSLARKQKKSWATGLVNGVLRNFIRLQDKQKEDLEKKIQSKPQAIYSHPQWIIDRLKKDWPEKWRQVLEQNNLQAPMVLRVNQQKISIDDYLSKLNVPVQNNINSKKDFSVFLEHAADVAELPGYEEGWFSVQDAGAQKAAQLMDLKSKQNVLDCCAAPGGKTCHIFEIEPDINMTAMDISDQRLLRVQENLERLGFSAELLSGDAAHPEQWWDGSLFDRILLDVPCSASGVIRRHPDIKLLRRPQDIKQLVETQKNILNKIWALLKPGGKLLYATCSVFKDENENQMATFLQQQADAEEVEIDVDWGETRSHGRQILTGDEGMDGFYYALLTKKN